MLGFHGRRGWWGDRGERGGDEGALSVARVPVVPATRGTAHADNTSASASASASSRPQVLGRVLRLMRVMGRMRVLLVL